MYCSHCQSEAFCSSPRLCKKHFEEFILQQVQETIDTYDLFTKKTRLCIGLSGGKDSFSLADILLRLGYHVEGLFINEGIQGYREYARKDIAQFVREHNMSFREITFQEEFGFTLDQALRVINSHPCTVCGTLRRFLLNKYASQYDVILTGHNLDDGAQTVLLNLMRGNTELFFRQSIRSQAQKGFTPRVKPLFFIQEHHLALYAQLRNFPISTVVCPNSSRSVRFTIKHKLRDMENTHPGIKKNIVRSHLSLKKHVVIQPSPLSQQFCGSCGQPSRGELCKACRLIQTIQENV